MVFFNYATMQMAAKIVYYGPGLCGKTTNLHHIYQKTSPQSRGEMVSLETETDRTLFFDLLPIDVGVIGGFKTRLQLYTVPGQVFYNTTRKLVLKGVDGIVFVADSQKPMLEANVESFKNLRENLAEIGTNLDEIPLVIQLNKRDLPNIHEPDAILDALDPERKGEAVEAVASSGTGVFETLKVISKLTLRTLRRRMTGDEPAKAAPAARAAQFRVQDNQRTMAGSAPAPARAFTSTATVAIPAAEALVQSEPEFDAEAAVAASLDRRVIADAPVADLSTAVEEAPVVAEPEPVPVAPSTTLRASSEATAPPPAEEVIEEVEVAPERISLDEEQPSTQYVPPAPLSTDTAPASVAEPEIDFSQTAQPQKAEPEVKTVKVRSSVDIMAELEALRKRATNTSPKAPKRDILADLSSLRPKRDVSRTLNLQLPADVLGKAKSVRVTLSFEDGEQGVIDTQQQQLELGDTSDVRSLSVNLKIDPA